MVNYNYKYNKYVKKNIKGGSLNQQDINYYTNELNSLFDDGWCYTGSTAIYLYCKHLNINCNNPNDLDVIFVPDSCRNPKPLQIGNLTRKQDANSNNGIPYYDSNNKSLLDLICQDNIKYIKLNNYHLIPPNILLSFYKEKYDDDKANITLDKINIIKNIIELFNDQNIIEYPEKKEMPKIDYGTVQRNLFDDDDD
jgi:hypothetical protein